mmetsp:Transcript_56046/g.122566  ORF Transcript_56046/g.122566 Transcript_56046/m.122566 type:complete len:246 (+) Transcript_56046:601-1338(+)
MHLLAQYSMPGDFLRILCLVFLLVLDNLPPYSLLPSKSFEELPFRTNQTGTISFPVNRIRILEDPSSIAIELHQNLLEPLLLTEGGIEGIQESCPRLWITGVVENLHLFWTSEEPGAIGRFDTFGAQRIVHLMQLKVVGHVNVAPVPCEISGQIILLRAVPSDVLRMPFICNLCQGLLQGLQVRLQKHHTRIDATRLTPTVRARACSTKEEAAIHALTMGVAAPRTTAHGCWSRQLEQVVDVAAN